MKLFYSISILITLTFSILSCKKESPTEATIDPIFTQPYTTGIIKFDFQTSSIVNGITVNKDTTATFSSLGFHHGPEESYGYWEQATLSIVLQRLDTTDYQNMIFLNFVGTNLNTLKLPYTYQTTEGPNVQLNYFSGTENSHIDQFGNQSSITDIFAASTGIYGGLKVTILSKNNNRLQGTFSGTLTHAIDNRPSPIKTLVIKNGVFDIKIVEK